MGILSYLKPVRRQLDEEIEAYRRLYDRGYRPDYIIDVGAHEGRWTEEARRLFGPVPLLMVEPQMADRAGLEALGARLGGVTLVPTVLSDTADKTVTFYQLQSGSRSGSSLKPERSDVPRTEVGYVTETLDRVAGDHHNIFLKIDVQGAELDVLRGGEQTLARCSLVQLELAILPYNEGAPTMLEALSFMHERGFAPIDISGRTRIQGHLVQLDFLFAPHASPLRQEYFRFAKSALNSGASGKTSIGSEGAGPDGRMLDEAAQLQNPF